MDRKKAKEWGSDLIRTRISREPYVLQKRKWSELDIWEWGFIVFALLSIVLSVGFSIYQLVMAIIKGGKYVYPIIIIINNVFSVYFLWNGVLEELPFQILAQLGVKCIVWILDLIFFLIPIPSNETGRGQEEESETEAEIRNIRFYVSSAMLALTVASGGYVIYRYWKSNISIFRAVGTEPKYVRLRRIWNFCYSLILFDAVLFVTVLLHLCNFPEFLKSYATYYLIPLWLVAIVAYVLLGVKAIERESRLLTYTFYVTSHLQPIFIIFLLVKSTISSIGLLLFISIYVTSLLYLLIHIAQLISVVLIQHTYGRGLRQAAAREVKRQHLVASGETRDRIYYEGEQPDELMHPRTSETEL